MQLSQVAYLIIPLLQGFDWFDEGLQRSLRQRGWPVLTRPESMIMIHVVLEMTRPAEIARSLGLTRQAVHRTIANISEKGLFRLEADPDDGRSSVIVLTAQGAAMRKDAQHIVTLMYEELRHRLGSEVVDGMVRGLKADWGPVPSFGPDDRRLS